MPFTYMLLCRDGSLYVGSTRNLDLRMEQHASGTGSAYTRHRRPVRLIWYEEHEHVGAAFAREKQLQKWSRAKRLALVGGRDGDLPGLSVSRYRRG